MNNSMESITALPSYSDGYRRVPHEKNEADTSDGGSISESDGLITALDNPSRLTRVLKSKAWILVLLAVNAILFVGFLVVGILTVNTVRRQILEKAPSDLEDFTAHKVALEPTKYYNKNGLRTTADGVLMECGSTHEEAAESECIFDNWAYYYVPPACFDEEHYHETASNDYILAPHAGGDFNFFMDKNKTILAPTVADEQASHLFIYALEKFHKAHCMYMWRLMNRAFLRLLNGEKDVYVLSATVQYSHTEHCMELMADPDHDLFDVVEAVRANGRCVRLDEIMPGDMQLPPRIQI